MNCILPTHKDAAPNLGRFRTDDEDLYRLRPGEAVEDGLEAAERLASCHADELLDRPPRKAHRVGVAITGVAFVLIGAAGTAVGWALAAANIDPEEITITETVTETVEVAPQECVAALDAAEELVETQVELGDILAESVMFGIDQDGDRINEASEEINDLVPVLAGHRSTFDTNADTCRAAAG